MDYMGACLYPESLVRSDATFLRRAILGNTHSFSTRYALEFYDTGEWTQSDHVVPRIQLGAPKKLVPAS